MGLTNLTYQGTTVQSIGSTGVNTFTGLAIGTAASDRWVLGVFSDVGDNQTITSITIGGVTATILYDPLTNAHDPVFFMANVTSGTTADFVVTMSGSQVGTGAISVYTFNGTPNTTKTDGQIYSGLPASFPGKTLTVKNGGFAIEWFQNGKQAGSPSSTWGASSPGMTNDEVNKVFTTATYINLRHATYSADGTQDCGSLTGGTVNIRIGGVSIEPSASVFTATIDQTLSAITQSASVTETEPSSIAQTLHGITQDFEALVVTGSAIAMTLPSAIASQTVTVVESEPTHIDQTLLGIVQDIEVVMQPSGSIDQTLLALTQSLVASCAPRVDTTIDQTLPGFTQEIDVQDKFVASIAQTLPGFTMEADMAEVIIATSNMILGLSTGTLECTFIGHKETGTFSGFGGTVETFTGFNFGGGGSNFYAVVQVAYGTGGIRTPASVTIDGVNATFLCRSIGINARAHDIWYAAIPAGGTGNVVVNFNNGNNGSVAVWTIRGAIDSVIPTATGNGISFIPTLTARSGGIGFMFGSGTAAGVFTFTEPPTQDFVANQPVSTAYRYTAGHESLAVSSWSPSGGNTGSLTDWSAVVFMPAVGGSPSLSQQLNMNVSTTVNIDQTLPGFTQEIDVRSIDAQIDQTLPKLTQTWTGHVEEPFNVIAHLIDTVLPGFTQEIDTHVTPNGDIDQTLLGFTQDFEANTINNADGDIDQTFEGFSQRLNVIEEIIATIDMTLPITISQVAVVEEMIAHIDQTLPGFEQEIDVISIAAQINQTLLGFTQEIDVAEEIQTHIDQTLLGFMQDFEGFVEEPAGQIAGNIEGMTLFGFSQEIDIYVSPVADIAVELMGFSQRADVHVKGKKAHERQNTAATMPSKEMPVHPGELELFRRKVYARAVDAAVPPTVIAQANLTTTRHPTSRPPVNRTPLGKPKS